MSLTPISRDELRLLKAQNDEKLRLERINHCISGFYQNIRHRAETTTNTSYLFALPPFPISRVTRLPVPEPEFHRDNMTDILRELQTLFPECIVEHANMVKGHDGKMYNVSKMDDKVLPFINTQQTLEFIVVDWS
jgi:hypothetical protein